MFEGGSGGWVSRGLLLCMCVGRKTGVCGIVLWYGIVRGLWPAALAALTSAKLPLLLYLLSLFGSNPSKYQAPSQVSKGLRPLVLPLCPCKVFE